MSDNSLLDRIVRDETRRSFLKKSAVATAGVGTAATGVASAQDGEDGGEDGVVEQGPWKALIYQGNFHPEARFSIISEPIDWNPNFGGIDDSWFSGYNTRMIKWLNTGEHVQLFVADDAELGQYDQNLGFVPDDQDQDQPQVYEVSPEWSIFEDDPKLATINFSPADEEVEDQIIGADDWWQDDATGEVVTGDGAGGNQSGNETGQ